VLYCVLVFSDFYHQRENIKIFIIMHYYQVNYTIFFFTQVKRCQSKVSELESVRNPYKQVLSATKRKRRMKSQRKTPSLIQSENSEKLQDRFVKPRTSRKRKHEIIEACAEIHGATESDKRPCLDGMWVSLVGTVSSEQLKNYVTCSKKAKKVFPSVVNKEEAKFEESTDNTVRSVKVLYCKGLISKEKYKSVRQSMYMKSDGNSARRSCIKIS